jgi:hypothetical protein
VIASPSVLADGTRFPTLYWLTCPWLIERAGALESEGILAEWAERIASQPELGPALDASDRSLRERRGEESEGSDVCSTVGIAGQRDPRGVKCLHAHVALSLAGIDDPIGGETLELLGSACENDLCRRFLDELEVPGDTRPEGPSA